MRIYNTEQLAIIIGVIPIINYSRQLKLYCLALILSLFFALITLFTSFGYQSTELSFRVINGIPHLPSIDPSSVDTPSLGMFIYSTTDKCPLFFNGKRWGSLCDNDLTTNTPEDYFVVKEGIPFLPVKSTLTGTATSGSIYYSADLKSTMVFNGTDWVRIADMPNSDYILNDDFSTQSGEIKTCNLLVLDKDPVSTELFEGAFYINSVSKSIRFYNGTEWKDISCIPVIETLDVSILTDLNTVSGGNIISNSATYVFHGDIP